MSHGVVIVYVARRIAREYGEMNRLQFISKYVSFFESEVI